jgi:hypothetical protein
MTRICLNPIMASKFSLPRQVLALINPRLIQLIGGHQVINTRQPISVLIFYYCNHGP